MIISAGGLTKDNKWKKSSEKFFIPVKVLSKTNGKAFLCPVCNKETLKMEDINRKIISTA